MHELHATIFSSLLPRTSCDGCDGRACNKGSSITSIGDVSRADDPTAVVTWPKCPVRYMGLRSCGQDALPLSHVVAYAHDRGVHRSPLLGAGGHRLIREWSRCRKLPSRLHEARAAEKMRRKREAP